MTTADLVIGIDCSTTAAKAVAWDRHGRAVAVGRRGYGLSHVRSGWVEQHAPDWWSAVSGSLAEVAAKLGSHRIAGLGITHQRETFVCLDKAGEPIRPAITWMDVRATAEVTAFGSTEVHRITGKPPNPTPAWYKLLWLRKHEPETIARTAHVVDVAGYLVHKLTGEWATSWACADPLGLVDLPRFDYHDELLAMVNRRGWAAMSRGQGAPISILAPARCQVFMPKATAMTWLTAPWAAPCLEVIFSKPSSVAAPRMSCGSSSSSAFPETEAIKVTSRQNSSWKRPPRPCVPAPKACCAFPTGRAP